LRSPNEGAAEGGCGGNSAAPEPKSRRGGINSAPAALLVQSRVPQKSFLFLLEEKEIARQIKKCEENFFAEQRAKRAAAERSVSFAQRNFEQSLEYPTNRNFRRFGKGLPRGFAARHSGFASYAKP